MKVAHFNFEDKLRWLLPNDKRNDNFDYPFNGPQSVKHLIEAVGIPHTEIGEVKANGESIGLGYLVQDGERIEVKAVIPAGEQIAEPRFVLDCHLGRLAAYLRMLGLDSLYRNNFDDKELVQAAVDEDRILLTRDRRLLMHKNINTGQLLRSLEPGDQLHEVIERHGLKKWIKPFKRCIRCNTPLEPVRKEEVLEYLQPLTRLYFEEFHICPACKQIYWKGSHYERMQKIIEGIEKGK
jgi:uncharacterized protein with PIN domain